MSEDFVSVRVGDRLLLQPAATGLADFAWAEVELVDFVEEPSGFPWAAGPGFPYRVAYRIDVMSDDPAGAIRRGVVWLDADGHDPVVGVRRIDRRCVSGD